MTETQFNPDQSFAGTAYTDPSYKIPITREYLTEEVGQSGVKNYSGFLDTDEWVGDFKGTQLYQTVDYMRNDAIIAALERGFFLPIEAADVHFEYDNKDLVNDPHYKSILEFIEADFANVNMPAFLHNANLCIPYGFSCFEQCYESREDGYLHLAKLAPRLPKTAWKWLIDGNGNLVTFIQYTYTPQADGAAGAWKFIPIPVEKLLLITHQKEGGNFVGRSEYRPFYREWKIKDTILKQMIITISRVGGGVPLITLKDNALQGGDTTLSTLEQAEKMAQKMMGSEAAYFVGQYIEKAEMFGINPQAMAELRNTVLSLDESIAKSAFQMFMNLGTSSTGSRSLGDTFEGLYYMGLEGKASTICGAVNEQVIKRLIDYNFGPQTAYPKFCLDIKQDMSDVLKLMGDMKRFGLIQGNSDLENFAFNYYGLPITTKDNALQPVPSTPAEESAMPDAKPADGRLSDKIITLSDVKLRRNPKRHESNIDFEKHADELNTIKKSLALELRHVVEPAMIDMGKQLAAGQKIYQTKVNFGNKAADLYRKYYARLLAKGKSDIKSELNKKGANLNDKIYLDDVKGKTNDQLSFEQWANEQSNIESYMIENDAEEAMAEYYSAGLAKGLTGDELASFMIDMITAEKGARYTSAADDVLGAYGTVREVSAEEYANLITSKTRSAIFDQNICEHCADEDGITYTKGDDGEFYNDAGEPAPDLPDPDCEGMSYGNKCRCLYVYNADGGE